MVPFARGAKARFSGVVAARAVSREGWTETSHSIPLTVSTRLTIWLVTTSRRSVPLITARW